MTPIAETIPDQDDIHRLIDFPYMYNEKSDLIWENIFQFSNEQPESVVWGKYAPTEADIHKLGVERELRKQQVKPNMRYIGFISCVAEAIRKVQIKNGHGFSLSHGPLEGIHHAEICYQPNGKMNKIEKTELKVALKGIFGPLVKRP